MLISHVHEWNIILVTRDTVLHACHLNETGSRGDNLLIKKKIRNSQKYIVFILSRNENIHKYNFVGIETAKDEYIHK